jgi:hypothetical protein
MCIFSFLGIAFSTKISTSSFRLLCNGARGVLDGPRPVRTTFSHTIPQLHNFVSPSPTHFSAFHTLHVLESTLNGSDSCSCRRQWSFTAKEVAILRAACIMVHSLRALTRCWKEQECRANGAELECHIAAIDVPVCPQSHAQ